MDAGVTEGPLDPGNHALQPYHVWGEREREQEREREREREGESEREIDYVYIMLSCLITVSVHRGIVETSCRLPCMSPCKVNDNKTDLDF